MERLEYPRGGLICTCPRSRRVEELLLAILFFSWREKYYVFCDQCYYFELVAGNASVQEVVHKDPRYGLGLYDGVMNSEHDFVGRSTSIPLLLAFQLK